MKCLRIALPRPPRYVCTDRYKSNRIRSGYPVYIKNSYNLTTTKNPQTTQFKKWAKDLNRNFSKEDIQMANRHTKRWSTLVVSWEMQIEATVRYHFTSTRMAIIKNKYIF